jgi:PGF-pre-PGF domain-containing protein
MKKQTVLMLSILLMLTIPTMDVSAANPFGTNKGKVIITFDDGLISAYTVAMPILQNNSQKAVSFVYPETINGATDGGGVYYTDFMNVDDVRNLASLGWDISSHSYTHCCEPGINYLSSANNSILYHELIESKSWIWSDVPVSRGAMFFSYPYGEYRDPLPTNLKLTGYVAARTVENTPLNQDYVLGNGGAMKMTTMQVDKSMSSGSIKNLINNTVNGNTLLILTFHGVVDNATGAYDYPTTSFVNISNYLHELNSTGNVQVMTFSEYFGVPATIDTFVPEMPINPNWDTSSRKSINFSWTDGNVSGNGTGKTDVFDVTVNGVTTYFVANRSISVPAQPGKRVDVSVAAVNQSWGKRTLSLSPLDINATIQAYMPSTPVNMASIIGESSIITNWTTDNTLNRTDFVNINILTQSKSTWYNESKNTSVSVTGLSKGQSVTVKVYALNGTNGATIMNETPAELTTSLPVTEVPVVLTATSDSANFSMSWTYKAGLNTTDVETTVVESFENGTYISSTVEKIPLLTNVTGGKTVNNLPPHVVVNFSVRGVNNTGPYSDRVYANQSLANNPVILTNIVADYNTAPGSVFKLSPIAKDLDNDPVVFTDESSVNDTSINPSTGEFVFNTVNATIGRYSFNITAKDDHGSNQTIDFRVFVVNNPPPTRGGGCGNCGGSSGGSGGSVGSSEDFSNLAKYEVKDGYVSSGKDNMFEFTALNPGIYQVILNGPAGDITVRAENLKNRQKGVDNVSGNALLYSNLMVGSERMTGLSFKFRMNKSEITNADNVKAFVWANSTWKPLDTKVLSSDENSVYFQSVSEPSKLSKFAFAETETTGNMPTLSGATSSDIVKVQSTGTPIVEETSASNSAKAAPGFGIGYVVVVLSVLYLRRRV